MSTYKKMMPLSPDGQLKAAFKITDKDLDDNRHGRLSSVQKKHIRGWQWVWSVIFWGFVLLLARSGTGKPWSIEVRALIGVCLIGIFWLQITTRRVFSIGSVNSVSGPVVKDRLNTAYTIGIENRIFVVPYQIYEAFIEGADYTLYYVPTLNYLVSAEHDPHIVMDQRKTA